MSAGQGIQVTWRYPVGQGPAVPDGGNFLPEQQFVDVFECAGQRLCLVGGEQARGGSAAKPLGSASADLAHGNGQPPGQRRDGKKAAALEVQTAAVLAGMLDHEVADETHRGPGGQGVAQQRVEEIGAAGGFAVGNEMQNQQDSNAQTQSQVQQQQQEIESQRRQIEQMQQNQDTE